MQNQSEQEEKFRNISQNDNVFDLVKIKVRLDEHFYIFSRFLISRMLTLSRIKKLDAIQIAKDIKKQLIEKNLLEINQHELEKIIFQTMEKFNYQNNIQKYQMVSNFYRKRTPMIILIFGAPCMGKSILANNLAERLNISNVLQTEIVEMVMRSMDATQFDQFKSIYDFQGEMGKFIEIYHKSCRVIRKGVSTDISKCLQEGKAVIIEGWAAMPNIYLEEINKIEKQEDNTNTLLQDYIKNDIKIKKKQRKDLSLFNDERTLQNQFKIIYPQPDKLDQNYEKEQKVIKDLNKLVNSYLNQNQTGAMIIGFHPIITRNDHLYNIENNISKKSTRETILQKLEIYQCIQQELLKQKDKCIVLPINLHNLEETLDTMHDIILQKIQQL